MKLFDAVPSDLFSVLASPNRVIYSDALDVLYEAYQEGLRIPEDRLYSMPTIIERSEATARRAFKANHKGAEISDIELIDSDVSATKDQERETLEKIKAMVAELGPQSYLATAFEGCFEDAEQNIEDDVAYSMKARLDIQVQRAIERGHEVDRLKADLAATQSKLETLLGQFDFASQYIKKLERQQLPEQLRRDLWVMVAGEAEASRARMAEAADKMAVGADNPGCVQIGRAHV